MGEQMSNQNIKIEYRIGAKDHGDTGNSGGGEDGEVRAISDGRDDKLKRASPEYKMISAFEGTFYILVICALVIVDVNFSLSKSMSQGAADYQVALTIYFILELIARAYCYSEIYDIFTFVKSPLTIIDFLCIFTDLVVLGTGASESVRAINVLRLARFVKAADWLNIIENIRGTSFCVAILGKAIDTSMEDQVAEEKKLALEEMSKLGIFLPSETVEVIEPVNNEPPTETYKDIRWRDAVVVRINDKGIYTVKFAADGEYWDRCPANKIRRDIRKETSVHEVADDEIEQPPPDTWQYHCLIFQESIPATFFICAIVFLELFLISDIKDSTSRSAWGLVITLFFFLEIVLRFYVYFHTYNEMVGFFLDPFRIIDVLLVLIDIILVIIVYTLGGVSDARAIRLIRIGRLARNAKGLKTLRSLRSLKFIYACFTCKLPTSPQRMMVVLKSTTWSVIIVMVSIVQFVLIYENVWTDRQGIYFMTVLLCLFLMEVFLALGLSCALHSDPLYFFKQPINTIEFLFVIVGVLLAANSLITERTVGEVISYVLCARVVRFFFIVHQHRVAIADFFSPEEEDEGLSGEGDDVEMNAVENIISSDYVTYSGNRGVKYGDGCVYQGDWLDGLEEGPGQLTFPEGAKYKGNFKRGLKHGRGLFLFENGDKFQGSFAANRKQGKGAYTWVDGDKFEANFVNGYEHGKASLFSTDGRVTNYFFNNGIEVPTPDEESKKQSEAAANYKGLNFKDILAP